MAYLYLCAQYTEKDASDYGQLAEPHFERIKNLPNAELKHVLERFGGTALLKKKADNLRIILQEVPVNEQIVYCVRTVLPRGSALYNPFHYKENAKKWLDDNPITSNELEKIKRYVAAELDAELRNQALPSLPEPLKAWITNKPFFTSNATIYETQEWTETIREASIYNFKETICDLLSNIQDNNAITTIYPHAHNRKIQLAHGKHQLFVLFEKVTFEDEQPILMLYKIFKDAQPDENTIHQVIKNYKYGQTIQRSDLIRDAKRAYPDYILIVPELWFKIQEDSVANLALSPEEENLLQSATFPLFINGQAGSGKSTMLFYLFAHFCAMPKDGKPLFLTYNTRLLETAKKNVISILTNYPTYSENLMDMKVIEKHFHPFQDFILNQLLTEKEQKLFSKNKYISFNKFKQAFLGIYAQEHNINCQLRNRGKFSPELVWHIIRTYIKGYDYVKPLNVLQYNDLTKKDKSVSGEKYQEVFTTIWKNWYSKFFSEFGYWDDQDLIQYVLKHWKKEAPTFPVVFCDEAQDFTRIEIELLLRLSSFTKYDLSNQKNIPFSFAGDPYQTINPTGFRWETLKTIFNEKFEKLNNIGLNIHFQPLSQNYRSKPAIIKFSNLIQGFRFIHLKIQELRPQMPWQKMEGVSPCIFIVNQDITIHDLKGVADKTITIIPTDADENHEYTYVKQDALLSQFIQLPEDSNTPIYNVMSASTAKGLEFDRVILYNFGDSVPNAFARAIQNEVLNDSDYIELAHFFNKLYVAVSRSRNFLFILDTLKGFNTFWHYFMNADFMNPEIEKQTYWQATDIEPLLKGLPEQKQELKEEHPEKIAKELEEYGNSQGNYVLLQKAQQYYALIGLDNEALRCEAWAYWYKEMWQKAGHKFENLGEKDQASKAYWKGQYWADLKLLHETDAVGLFKIRRLLADFMLKSMDIHQMMNHAYEWLELCDMTDDSWKAIVEKLQNDLKQELPKTEQKLAEYAQQLKKLAAKGFKELYELAGSYHFKDNSYEEAIACWDRTLFVKHTDYYTSKFKLETDPNDKISWLQELKNDSEIIKVWENTAQSKFVRPDINRIIFYSLLRKTEFDRALRFELIDLGQRVKDCLKWVEDFTSDAGNNSRKKVFDLLLDNGTTGIDLIKMNIKAFKDFFDDKDVIRRILVHSNWKEFVDELDRTLRKAFPGRFVETFVEVVCEEIEAHNITHIDRFSYSIGLVDEVKDKLPEYLKLIKAIAYSNVTPEMLSNERKEHLEAFVTTFCAKKGWEKALTHQEISAALERIGAKSITLQKWYEQLIQDERRQVEVADWAKMRWIKAAKRRMIYEKERKNETTVERIAQDVLEKQEIWNISDSMIEQAPPYPILKKMIAYEFENTKITGFDGQPKTDIRRKRIILEVDGICEVRVNCISRLVSVEDFKTDKTVDIEMEKQKVSGLDVERKRNIFDIGNRYQGELVSRSELKLMIEKSVITIKFNK